LTYIDINKIEEIRIQLESIQESLLDVSSHILQQAIEDGQTKAPPEDKKIVQALRAVTKSINSLQYLENQSSSLERS